MGKSFCDFCETFAPFAFRLSVFSPRVVANTPTDTLTRFSYNAGFRSAPWAPRRKQDCTVLQPT